MKIWKKKCRGVLVLCFLCVPFAGPSAQELEDLVEKRTPAPKKTIEEDIQYLHQKLPGLLKTLQLDNKPEVIFDMGAIYKPEVKGHYVFVNKVSVKISGESLSEVHFMYDLSNELGVYRETREFLNKGTQDQNCKDLTITYKNSRGEIEEFAVGSILNEKIKTRVLRMYLANLNQFIRWLDFYARKGVIDQDKTIHKVLRVGGVS